jgi:thiamine biosynthesis lipoprotein
MSESAEVAPRVFGVVVAGVLIAACSQTPPAPARAPETPRLVERARLAMGSELRLTAWTADEPNALLAFEHVFDDFDYLDRLLSVWHETSEVARLNAAAGDRPVAIRPEVLEVLQIGQQIAGWTNGKFDVTFGALSGLWKFDHDQDDRVPPAKDVAARLPLVGYEGLEIDTARGTAFLRRRGMRVHLGGIGKGYAVDRAATMLRSHGINDFLIQAGGDLYASGRRGDRPWRGGIRDPRGEGLFAAMDLADTTFSTSGDYERSFVAGGRRYHHILDPDVGQPARGSRSVTIVARRAAIADGLSTGVFVMGPDAGMALIETLPDVDGVIVTDANEVRVSSGLKGRLELLAPPTDAP